MNFIVLVILTLCLGVGLSLLFNKLVIKDFPENRRKGKQVATFFVFILMINGIAGSINSYFFFNKLLNEKAVEMDQYVKENHSDNAFVRHGLDMSLIQNDISRLNNAASELGGVFTPILQGYDLPPFLTNMIVGYISTEIEKRLLIVNAAGSAANTLVDENNFITVSSLLSGLVAGIMKAIKTVIIIIVVIFSIILLSYIIGAFSTVSKEKKKIKEAA